MYIPPERREAEIKRLSQHGVVDFLEVKEAVDAMLLVSHRVEAVARIIANQQEQFANVGNYDWLMQQYRIEPVRNPDETLRDYAFVVVDLLAEKKDGDEDRLTFVGRGGHYDDGRDAITRRVEFPVSYLTSDDWVDETAMQARSRQLRRLIDERDAAILAVMNRRYELEDAEARLETIMASIAQLEETGVREEN